MERKEPLRELFIDELAEVRGGVNPIEELVEKLAALSNVWEEHIYHTTHACGEEGPDC